MDFIIISLIIFAFSFCLCGIAGFKSNYRLLFLSLLAFVLGGSFVYLGVKAKESNYNDECSKAGGHYVLDEKVQLKGETALDLYKCVK